MGKKKKKIEDAPIIPIRVPGDHRFPADAIESATGDRPIFITGTHTLQKPLIVDKDLHIHGDATTKLISQHCHGILHRGGKLKLEDIAIETVGTGSCALMLEGLSPSDLKHGFLYLTSLNYEPESLQVAASVLRDSS